MIGIFDSGVGGLTVMKEFLKRFPDFDYLYLGDQANVPYGSRSPELINRLVEKNAAWMIQHGCQLIIIACNTASAEALRHAQQIYKGTPVILGVLVPAVEAALAATKNGNIGVIGTRGTIASHAYEREIAKRAGVIEGANNSNRKGEDVGVKGEGEDVDPRLQYGMTRVYPEACPLLVPLIEEGWAEKPETTMILKKYLRPLKSCHIDTLILGCTHYPILEKKIRRIMGKNVAIVNSGEASAEAMKSYLDRHPDVCSELTRNSEHKFYTTDDPERLNEQGLLFLGKKIKAQKAEIC
ncbi:glutamate racemase [Candidatus Peregrinibacteria bacterium]|nr:glutamate racemase [Candidatus Peregrinibacteria bacterium]